MALYELKVNVKKSSKGIQYISQFYPKCMDLADESYWSNPEKIANSNEVNCQSLRLALQAVGETWLSGHPLRGMSSMEGVGLEVLVYASQIGGVRATLILLLYMMNISPDKYALLSANIFRDYIQRKNEDDKEYKLEEIHSSYFHRRLETILLAVGLRAGIALNDVDLLELALTLFAGIPDVPIDLIADIETAKKICVECSSAVQKDACESVAGELTAGSCCLVPELTADFYVEVLANRPLQTKTATADSACDAMPVLSSITPFNNGDDVAVARYQRLLHPVPLCRWPDANNWAADLRKMSPGADSLITALEGEMALAQASGKRILKFRPILLVGPPGIGKTRIVQHIALAMGVPYIFLPFSGSNDNVVLAGTARGWHSARPSFLADEILRTECANPIVCLDELEKIGVGERNGRLWETLLTLLEPSTSELPALDNTVVAELRKSFRRNPGSIRRLASSVRHALEWSARIEREHHMHMPN